MNVINCIICQYSKSIFALKFSLDVCVDETNNCLAGDGFFCRSSSYNGRKNTTISGRTCQNWGVNYPHQHTHSSDYLVEGEERHSLENHCRVKDEDQPWCYTTDPKKRWEFCFERCTYLCVDEKRGCVVGDEKSCHIETYRGTKSVTSRGLTCQRWDSQFPHKHKLGSKGLLRGESIRSSANYCRIKDEKYPWCYTTDPNVRWQYCFERCPARLKGRYYNCVDQIRECANPGKCAYTSYSGRKFTTRKGIPCQDWKKQSPHTHSVSGITAFYGKYLVAGEPTGTRENFCRVKDFGEPWCYTVDPNKRWDFCFDRCPANEGKYGWLNIYNPPNHWAYRWLDGSGMNYVNWGPGQNGYGNNKPCAVISGTDGKWFERDCGTKANPVCKYV